MGNGWVLLIWCHWVPKSCKDIATETWVAISAATSLFPLTRWAGLALRSHLQRAVRLVFKTDWASRLYFSLFHLARGRLLFLLLGFS